MRRMLNATILSAMINLFFWTAVSVADDLSLKDEPVHDVVIGVYEYPPLYHTAAGSGNFSGILGETVRAICKAAKINCIFKRIPVARAYRYVETGETHALLTGKHAVACMKRYVEELGKPRCVPNPDVFGSGGSSQVR